MLIAGIILQFACEGLVQQRLLQRLQRGELPLVEAGEALGFGTQRMETCNDRLLLSNSGIGDGYVQ